MASPQTPPTAEEAAMTQALASDRPTIDSAIKSYISLVCAKNLTASATDVNNNNNTNSGNGNSSAAGGIGPGGIFMGILKEDPNNKNPASVQQNILAFSRTLLSTANSYTFPIHDTVAATKRDKPGTSPEQKEYLLELSIVSQIWNGLIQSQQKPSKYLGRRALKHAWEGLEMESKLQGDAQKLLWLKEFEKHLFYQPIDVNSNITTDDANDNDNDAALLWDADGGKAELARRQKRRQQAATLRKSTQNDSANPTNIPTIEEVDE